MAAKTSRKKLIKAVVLTVGLADCVGIYLANDRLGESVPDSVRYDRTAYTVPESANMFHAAEPAMFADAASAKAAVQPAAPAARMAARAAAPVLELAAAPAAKPAAAAPLAHALAAAAPVKAAPAPKAEAPVAQLAMAAPAKAAPAAKVAAPAAPKLAVRSAEGPRKAAMSRVLASLQPVAKAAPATAPAHAAIVTPHLAKVERPEAVFHSSGAKIVSAKQTAALTLGHAAPAKSTLRHAPAKAATSLAGLVPKARSTSEFSSAFAGFDAPLAANVPLEQQFGPADGQRDGGADLARNQSASPVLELTLPEAAPAPELPAMTATAETADVPL